MIEKQGRQLLVLAARADHLAKLRESKRLSEEDYIARLNELRRQAGLEPLELRRPAPPAVAPSTVWESI
jgi:hypothetical protein